MQITNESLFNFRGFIAEELFTRYDTPWEILPKIGDCVFEIAAKLTDDKYRCLRAADGELNIFVALDAKIDKSATLYGPLIIDSGTEVRPGAYIRGNVIIGKNCVIGNSTEIKNSIIMDNVQLPHYNYVGDSILGNHSHIGAGGIVSNLKSTKTEVLIEGVLHTGLRKVGAFIGDNVEIGCNAVLNPGTIIGKDSIIYPLTCVRGVIPENSIVKTELTITRRSKR